MSLGMTPYEFVQQVFYVQEKVLLDFHPDDDVYKEVLVEANLVLQELQKEEDWLWLRDTVNLGFVVGHPPFGHLPKDLHWRRFQHDLEFRLPENVYKPSELYGDCVRLCRYNVNHHAFVPFLEQALGYKRHWQAVVDKGRFDPDRSFVFYGEFDDHDVDLTNIEYGGTFPFPLHTMRYEELPKYVKRGKWYVDEDGYMFVGDYETWDEDPAGVVDTETPPAVYMMNSVPVDPVKPEEPPEPFDERFLEPAPHGYLESWRYWHCCWPWYPWPDLPDGLVILWDTSKVSIWKYVEVFENDFIRVPYMSAGNMHRMNVRETGITLQPSVPDFELGAVVLGDKITFTRPLHPHEMHRVALADCQMRLEPFHVCDGKCVSRIGAASGKMIRPEYPHDPCVDVWDQSQRRMLRQVPDPTYVIYRTAALHAQGSPPAQGRLMDLQDAAQKLLSAMRQNNAEFTTPDYVDWQPVDFVNVI